MNSIIQKITLAILLIIPSLGYSYQVLLSAKNLFEDRKVNSDSDGNDLVMRSFVLLNIQAEPVGTVDTILEQVILFQPEQYGATDDLKVYFDYSRFLQDGNCYQADGNLVPAVPFTDQVDCLQQRNQGKYWFVDTLGTNHKFTKAIRGNVHDLQLGQDGVAYTDDDWVLYDGVSQIFPNCPKNELINSQTMDCIGDPVVVVLKHPAAGYSRNGGLTPDGANQLSSQAAPAGNGYDFAQYLAVYNKTTGRNVGAHGETDNFIVPADAETPKERNHYFSAYFPSNAVGLGKKGNLGLDGCDPTVNPENFTASCQGVFSEYIAGKTQQIGVGNIQTGFSYTNDAEYPGLLRMADEVKSKMPSFSIRRLKVGGDATNENDFLASDDNWEFTYGPGLQTEATAIQNMADFFGEVDHEGLTEERSLCFYIKCDGLPGPVDQQGAVSNNSCSSQPGSNTCCQADADCGLGEVCMVDSVDVDGAGVASQPGQCVNSGDFNYNTWYCADQACADERNGCTPGVTSVTAANTITSFANNVACGGAGAVSNVANGGACSDGSECVSEYCDFGGGGGAGVCADAPAQASAFNYCENSKCIDAGGSVLSAYTSQSSCEDAGAYCKRNSDNLLLPSLTSQYDCEESSGQCQDVGGTNTGASSQYACEKDRCVDSNGSIVTSFSNQSSCESAEDCDLGGGDVRSGLCQAMIWNESDCITAGYTWTNSSCFTTDDQGGCSGYWNIDSYTLGQACSDVHAGAQLIPAGNTWVTNTGVNELTWVIPNTWVVVNNWQFPACSGKDSGGFDQYCVNENYGEATTNPLSSSFDYCTYDNGIRVGWMYSSVQGYISSVGSSTDCSSISHICKNSSNQFYLQNGALVGVGDVSDCPGSFSIAHAITHDGNAPTNGIEPKICQSTDGQNMSPCDFTHTINDCGSGRTCVGDRIQGGICSDLNTGSPCHDDGFLVWYADPGCSQPGDTCTYPSGGGGGAGSEKVCE